MLDERNNFNMNFCLIRKVGMPTHKYNLNIKCNCQVGNCLLMHSTIQHSVHVGGHESGCHRC